CACVAPCDLASSHSFFVEVKVEGSFVLTTVRKESMSPEPSHFCRPLGRSLVWTDTSAGPAADDPPGPHATTTTRAITPIHFCIANRVPAGCTGWLSVLTNVATCIRPRHAPRSAGRRERVHRLASARSEPQPEHGSSV